MENFKDFIIEGRDAFVPCLSLDCVIFGFHNGQLKILLLKMRYDELWALPGGFVYKDEDIDAAAGRILRERTGIKDIFLQQLHVFGDPNRSDKKRNKSILEKDGFENGQGDWLTERFITVGYYALVDFSKVELAIDYSSEICEWQDLTSIPSLIMDHSCILKTALERLRKEINYQPIGLNLLPAKFTMPELQSLYEAILGKKLDRRNFQRRMLGYGLVNRLTETRKGGAHKAPYLYIFDNEKYKQALEEGLQGGW